MVRWTRQDLFNMVAICALILAAGLLMRGVGAMTWTDNTPVPLPATWFDQGTGSESYGDLMRNGAHVEWELTLELVGVLVLDVIGGLLVWPAVKRHFHRDIEDSETEDDARHEALTARVAALEAMLAPEPSKKVHVQPSDDYPFCPACEDELQ